MKRKTAAAEISFFVALFCASFMSALPLLMLACLFVMLTGFALMSNKGGRMLAVFLVPAAAAFLIYALFLLNNYQKALDYDGKTADFTGKVIDSSYISNDLMTVTAKGEIAGKTKATVVFFLADKELQYGDEISLNAKFSAIKNNIEFGGSDYNFAKGIYLNGNATDGFEVKDGGFSLVRLIRNYSDYVYNRIVRIAGTNEGAFLGAMLCGNTDDLSSELKTDLFRMGIGHIFSVSGTHLVIITLLFGYILELTTLSRRKRLFVLELLVALFTVFAGMSPSVVRAAVMTTVINISRAVRRYPDPITTIGLCAVLMTAFTPYQVRSASFLLSLCGAFAITCAAPAFIRFINYSGRFKKTFNTFISMCVIWICNLPLSVMFFNEISIVSPMMNMIFVPFCSVALVLCVFAALLGCVGAFAEGLVTLSSVVIKPLLFVSQSIGDSTISYIPLGYEFIKFFVLAVVLLVVFIAALKRNLNAVLRATALLTALTLVVLSAGIAAVSQTPKIYFLCYKNSFALVLNNNRKAVIIDKDAKLADACVRLLESKGITEVLAVAAFEEVENTRAAYNKKFDFCGFNLDNCYKCEKIGELSALEFETQFDDDGFLVSNGDFSLFAADFEENYPQDTNYDCLFDLNGTVYIDGKAYDVFDDKDVGGIAFVEINDEDYKFGRVNYAVYD